MEVKSISLRDCVVILPLTADGEVVMVRQYRHGIEEVCLELPGGLVDPDDASPEAAAKRELKEETGCEARDFVLMGSCFPQPAVLDHRCFFILANNARTVCQPQPDAGEDIEIVRFALDKVPDLIRNGQISSGMVQLAFYKYFMHSGMSVPK